MTGEELRVALTSIRSTYTMMQESIEGETNLDFADQMIYESEEYLMGEVIKLFNEMDEEDVDWGQLKREELAAALREVFFTGGAKGTEAWALVADKAIEILLGGEEVA